MATAVDLTRRGGGADATRASDAAPATDPTMATLNLTMQDEKIVLPLAPALGLYLDRPYFEPYNNQLKDQPKATPEAERRRPLSWDEGAVCDEVEAFKKASIWGHIFATEARDHEFLQYGRSAYVE